jgi:hypothetical protein
MKPGGPPPIVTVLAFAGARKLPVLAILLLRSGLWAVSAALGGIGVFCALLSFSRPILGAHAVILIGAAIGITYSLKR